MAIEPLTRNQRATLVSVFTAVIFGVALLSFDFTAGLVERQPTAMGYILLSFYMVIAYWCWVGSRWGFGGAILLSLMLAFYNALTGVVLVRDGELMAAFLTGFNALLELLVVVFAYRSIRELPPLHTK